jgi:hypothetical protein
MCIENIFESRDTSEGCRPDADDYVEGVIPLATVKNMMGDQS